MTSVLSSGAAAWTPSTAMSAGPKLVAIDVECVATSPSPRDRAVALVAAVNENGERLFYEYVKPPVPVASTLTLITGICMEDLQTARPLAEVIEDMRHQVLGPSVVIVGHGVKSDISWLGLVRGQDYGSTADTAKLFSMRLPDNTGTMTPSLRHLAIALLNVDMQSGVHSPDVDARFAMQLYLMHTSMTPEQLYNAGQMILATPRPPPFAKRYPYIDGCALSKRSPQYDAQLNEFRRIIFLDIDGVLNRTFKNDEIHMDADLVENLKGLISAANAAIGAELKQASSERFDEDTNNAPNASKVGIVITTFWRSFLDYIKYVFFRKGLDASMICGATSLSGMHAMAHYNSATKSESESMNTIEDPMPLRSQLIEQYLAAHPWISHFCILDDRPDASNENLASHFVECDSSEGLTPAKVEEALACLRIAMRG